jgi:3',5'-cyclic AMP phosphodiesterase CpdA
MKFVTEPSIHTKIHRMKERVRWQHPILQKYGIDQTRLVIAEAPNTAEAFSFLVLGDSGTGRHRRTSPQREVAECVMAHGQDADFILHTGDVVYLVGSSEQYEANFIKPYREWIVGGEHYQYVPYEQMIFKRPFLPVLGNHDYYDLPRFLGFFTGIAGPLRYLLRSYVDLDVGWHGSFQGDAFARAFMDYLRGVPPFRLKHHVEQHYTSSLESDRCLTYQPGHFTRLPNRYYTFRYAGVDFFALDSNTFNQPLPYTLTADPQDNLARLRLQQQHLEGQKAEYLRQLGMGTVSPENDDEQEELTGQVEEIDEELRDIKMQLSNTELPTVDDEQLAWLRDRLIASWQNPDIRGRVLFFHHPPYVTEATKWSQGQTLAVRHHLRKVLDQVLIEAANQITDRPVVDLVLCGHAHCFEYLRTTHTGHGDAHIPWVVCGGSGYSLRRQRPEGNELTEWRGTTETPVAQSHLFIGRTGKGSTLKRPYSGLRVEVNEGRPLRLSLIPIVAEKVNGKWDRYTLDPIEL